MASPSFATSILDVEIETGAMKDEAKAITKSAEGIISIADPLDAKFLFTGEPGSLVIYNMAASDNFFMITGVGDSAVEISAENIGAGDFVVVNTKEPDGCTTLTLAECRADADFLSEKSFSITHAGVAPVAETPEESPASEIKKSILDSVLNFFGLAGTDDTATSSVTASAESQVATIIVSDTNEQGTTTSEF